MCKETFFANKGPYSESYGFSSSHAWMWELGYKEGWSLRFWCFQSVVLEKTLENPMACKEIKPVSPKGNQTWIFLGRTDAEAEAPILWPPDVKNWLIGIDADARKDWRQENKGMTGNEMVEWHHWLNGFEFEQVPGVGEGQQSLVLQSMGSQRVWHDWATELNLYIFLCKNNNLFGCEVVPQILLRIVYVLYYNCPKSSECWNVFSFQAGQVRYCGPVLFSHKFVMRIKWYNKWEPFSTVFCIQ